MQYTIGDYVFETDSEYNISITQGEYNSLGTVVDIRIDFGAYRAA